ncbi:MAG TPA: hypothetical protein PKK60_02305 [archaeon]|nr:hypothetical protein [archaeon]
MVAKGSAVNKSQIASKRILALNSIVASGARVSAREVQRRIGGERISQQELRVLISKLPLRVRQKLLLGTVRNQPKHHERVIEKKRVIQRFIISESLKGRSVSPKQLKLRYGGRMDTLNRLFNEISKDKEVISFLESKGAKITRTLPGGQRKNFLFP